MEDREQFTHLNTAIQEAKLWLTANDLDEFKQPDIWRDIRDAETHLSGTDFVQCVFKVQNVTAGTFALGHRLENKGDTK